MTEWKKIVWYVAEVGLLIIFLVVLVSCVIVQTVPERQAAPEGRLIIEQRQAQPVPPPRGGS